MPISCLLHSNLPIIHSFPMEKGYSLLEGKLCDFDTIRLCCVRRFGMTKDYLITVSHSFGYGDWLRDAQVRYIGVLFLDFLCASKKRNLLFQG